MTALATPPTAPLLATQRLELWLPARDDLAAMLAIIADPRTGRHLGPQPGAADHFVRFCRNAGSWLLYGYGSLILRRRESAEVIGQCGIFHSWRGLGADVDDRPEAGWILRHDCFGKGLAREAMDAAIGWFEGAHGPQPIVCMIDPANAPSLTLADRLGFAPLRDAVLPEGGAVRLLVRPAGFPMPPA